MQAELTRWEHPSDYAGFDPEGDILVASRHRDSDALSRSNYAAAAERLARAAGLGTIGADDDGSAAYDWRASHWAVGWIEYLMVRADAPAAVIAEAQAIADDLADYPVLDESAFSELEWNEAADLWSSMSIRDRIDTIKRHGDGVSVFAARRDWIPDDDNGAIYQSLIGY